MKLKAALTETERGQVQEVFDRWQDYYLCGENKYAFDKQNGFEGLFPKGEPILDEYDRIVTAVGMMKNGKEVVFLLDYNTEHLEIKASPDPWFVTMVDTFLSGWGDARGKKNVLIIECRNEDEANIVAENAGARGDQDNIDITPYEPDLNDYLPGVSENEMLIDRHCRIGYERWFKPQGF